MGFFDDFVKLKRYPNYGVSRDGRICSYTRHIVLRLFDNGRGYLQVQLSNINKKRRHERVHRLVAETFIPNPLGLLEINHKDKNKYNNSVDNLEWCDRRYNVVYSKGHGVLRINPVNGSIVEYESVAEAARCNNIMRSQITRCCMGKMKKSHGYYWEYRKEVD